MASRILDKLSESYKASKIKQLFFDHTSAKQPEVKLTIAKLIGPFVYNVRCLQLADRLRVLDYVSYL